LKPCSSSFLRQSATIEGSSSTRRTVCDRDSGVGCPCSTIERPTKTTV